MCVTVITVTGVAFSSPTSVGLCDDLVCVTVISVTGVAFSSPTSVGLCDDLVCVTVITAAGAALSSSEPLYVMLQCLRWKCYRSSKLSGIQSQQ